ncbi:DUF4442 domain-containing protein [Solitalea canadensis]|uniref:DUF4442 domain-containing protein n=1 Tax=Solitalea canadensis (strain ATCC 29591 / DSM 3403 / JCM 21819 / LMG 8368 / NBRC 15130 / NCIMB 12057 / USAM 9D) TaxID=929556 RepID=H8KVL4_SOLCM|nr:DUF4442 domain-containing protein [Solitalea canadensis]AFD06517.1 hypothetical protein Solca_1433 [Solitalea canadensis DSM 3403]
MKLSNNSLKWLMRFYPPLFFQRIWVKHISKDFKSIEVKINKSLLNKNYNGTIFGGTIFSAADPFYSIMFWQLFRHKSFKVIGWLKSAEIQYKKPGSTDLTLIFSLTEEDVREAEDALTTIGKFEKAYPVEARNKKGELCAMIYTNVWMRRIQPDEHSKAGF